MTPVAPPVHLLATLVDLTREISNLLLKRSHLDIMAILNFFHLLFELTDTGGPTFPECSLGGPVLSLALGWRGICGRLTTWLRTWWNDPFFGGD